MRCWHWKSPKQILVHILMSLAKKYPCNLHVLLKAPRLRNNAVIASTHGTRQCRYALCPVNSEPRSDICPLLVTSDCATSWSSELRQLTVMRWRHCSWNNNNIVFCLFVLLSAKCPQRHRQIHIQESRLLYYLIREIQTWLNINHITVHCKLTHIYI